MDGGVELHARRGQDATQRVVRGDSHVACFGQRRDLFAIRDSTGERQVRPDVRGPLVGQQLAELVGGVEPLAHGHGHRHICRDMAPRVHVLGLDGVLEKKQAIGLKRLGHLDGLRRREAVDHIDHEIDLVTHGVADRLQGSRGVLSHAAERQLF